MFYCKCDKCRSEWNGIKRLDTCPFCNFIFQIKNSNFTDIKDAFDYIFGKYGMDIIKQNNKLVSLLADYAPSLENERRLVRMALDAGIYSELLLIDVNDNDSQNIARSKAVNKLNMLYFLDPVWATKLVSWLTVQLNWSSEQKENHVVITNNTTTDKQEYIADRVPMVNKQVYVGENLYFGTYPQQSSQKYDLIEWEVITTKEGQALLLSKYCLDFRSYDKYRGTTTWENSMLRQWLNNDFYNDAFSKKEQTCILEKTLSQSRNPRSNVLSGNVTSDRVFILSYEDVNRYNLCIRQLQCKASVVAKKNSLFDYNCNGYVTWWLRTSGYSNGSAMYVLMNGKFDELGAKIDMKYIGVRPAIWVDLKILSAIEEM